MLTTHLHLQHHPLLHLPTLLFLIPHLCHARRPAPAPAPAPACRSATAFACRNPPFVPGHDLIGKGFDVVKLQTTGAFVVDVDRYQLHVSGNCTLCQNRLLGQEQKLPAAVADWRVRVKCRRRLSERIYETGSAILERNDKAFHASAKVGLALGNAAFLGGTRSKSSRFARSHSTQDRYSFATHQVSCRYYTLRLRDNPPLTRGFVTSLQTLPYAYAQSTAASFRHFLSTYGTHYLRRVDLGGRVRSTTAVRTCETTVSGLSVHDVSNCLSTEAAAARSGPSARAQQRYCRAKARAFTRGRPFSAAFSDRVTEVLGGSGQLGDILFAPEKRASYGTWVKSLKVAPGVVAFRLSPLHTLIDPRADPQRYYNLRSAIRDYVARAGVGKACRGRCAAGRRDRNCACKCNGHTSVDSNCCARKRGLARLSVVVRSAVALWGDYFSKTDGYVKVFYGRQRSTTPVIWNNNFPQWNFRVSFGTVDLLKNVSIRFEVWDRGNRWDDDLLGKFSLVPVRGVNVRRKFKLKHGALYASYSVVCAPSLAGSSCGSYSPSPAAHHVQAPLGYPSLTPHPSGNFWNNTFL
ncbi:perforin-1.3 [Sardina pilchardus]|uniref:perforin-1.3 n=1 Tax=Sardina pilchardus TaxID=27697 RepID=UPI002E101A82